MLATNHARLLQPLGHSPPAEAEANHRRQLAQQAKPPACTRTKWLPRKPRAVHWPPFFMRRRSNDEGSHPHPCRYRSLRAGPACRGAPFRLAASGASEPHILCALERDALDVSFREMLGGDTSAVKAASVDDARERLNQLASDPANRQGLAALPRVVSGNPLSVIAAEADVLDADLVVLGARGESFLRHAWLGSTAARLLRKSAQRPVLVVKQHPHEDYRSVLVAVDFSPVSMRAIRTAKRLAADADFVLLHAFELPYEGKLAYAGVDEQVLRQYIRTGGETRQLRLHDLAAAAGLAPTEYSARVIHGDPAQQIVAMEQEYDADLLVVGKHGIHLAEELLLGSVTKHVLAEAQGNVLVIADARPATSELM